MRNCHIFSVVMGLSLSSINAGAAVVYTDNFAAGSAPNWTVKASNTGAENDTVSEFGFDVSTRSIPNAPNGDNIVLRTGANLTGAAGNEAISLFLTGFPITTEYYEVTVDVYCAFAPPGGGTGTTRMAGVGIEHNPTPIGPNLLRVGTPYQAAAAGTGQDGLVFSYNTDDDDANSAIYLLEANAGDPFAALAYVGTWASGVVPPAGQLQRTPYYQGIIAANPNDGDVTNELMGNQWVTVRIRKQQSLVTVTIFGTDIITHSYAGIGNSLVSLTNERPFPSVTPSPLLSECYFDALTINDITPSQADDSWQFYN